MSHFDRINALGMAQANAIMGEPITIGTKPCRGVVSEVTEAMRLVTGGFYDNADTSVVLPLTELPKPPVAGEGCQHNGRSYRIANDGIRVDAISYTLALKSATH